jgi:hypothetical protein
MCKLLAIVLAAAPSAALAQQAPAAPAERPAKLTLYKTASSAACAGDVTVWLDPTAGVYYVRGERLYGKTRRGGYNCRRQADAAGYRASKAK